MSNKQKAVIVTDLLVLQRLAMEKTIFHEQEADRYRKSFHQITERIMKIGRVGGKV
jgi:hypothetical protein